MSHATAGQGAYTGRTVGQYHVLEMIGSGAMGEVYRAHDDRLKRTVAIKSLAGSLSEDRTARERFLRETRLACKVVHPYVATVFDVVEDDDNDNMLLVMEHIEGRSLSDILRHDRPSLGRISAWTLEIAEGLSAIHRAGMVHRDLKPGNVMVTNEGHVKVMDFGVARTVHSGRFKPIGTDATTAAATLTREGHGVGTVLYMSPEQVRGQKDVDHRSDLFSLGSILYLAITGKHPFARDSLMETASAILHEPPGRGEEPRTLTESGPLRQVTLRLLEKEPDTRYQTAGLVATDVRAASHGQRLSPWVTRAKPVWKTPRNVVAAAMAVAVLAVGYAAWRWWPKVAVDSRPVVAVMPFEDRTTEGADPFRGEMLADLLAADLGETGLVRPLEIERVVEILASAPQDVNLAGIRGRLARSSRLDWLLSGSLWREGDSFIASVGIFDPDNGAAFRTLEVRAGATAALVDLASVKVLEALFPNVAAASLAETEAARLSSSSEEARLLEYQARKAARELRHRDAIDLLEQAVEEDPRFAIAQARLAEVLHAAGYGQRSREAADRVARLAEQPGGVPSERQRLEIAAIAARVREDLPGEVEQRRLLLERFPDEPGAHFKLARALEEVEKLDRALSVIDSGVALDELDPRGHLLRADVLAGLERYDDADRALDRAEELFREVGSLPGQARVALQGGQVEFYRGEWPEAKARYEESARLSAEAGLDVWEARAIKAVGDAEQKQGNFASAVVRYEQAMPVARASGDYRVLIRTLGSLGAQLYAKGELDAAERYLRETVASGRDLDNPRLLLFPTINLAGLLNWVGKLGEGGALAEEALAVSRDLGLREPETTALLLMADSSYQRGHHEGAIGAYRDLIRLERREGGQQRMHAIALHGLAEVLLASGRIREANDSLDDAIELERELSLRLELANALTLRGRIGGELATWDEAERDLERAESLATGDEGTLTDVVMRIALARGLNAMRRGDWPEAERWLGGAREIEGQEVAAAREVSALAARCEVAIGMGEHGRAIGLCRQAIDHPRAMAVERVAARALLSRAMAGAGMSQEAEREGRQALDEAERIGAPLITAHAAAGVLASGEAKDDSAIRDRAARGLERYLDGAPEERRAAIRARADMAVLIEEVSR